MIQRPASFACIVPLLAALAAPWGSSCATSDPAAPVSGGAEPPILSASRGPAPVAPPLEPVSTPTRRPLAINEACAAQVDLAHARPVVFEGDRVGDLVDVGLHVAGPPGLSVSLSSAFGDDGPSWQRTHLPARVALRLPAGPALDKPAGLSGAMFDFGGLALAGAANLFLLPFSGPLGFLVGRPDAFIIDAPSFTDGMFSDIVLDRAAWEEEVRRRARPHTAALAREAERQGRFESWKRGLALERQRWTCVIDDDGECTIALLWPYASMGVAFAGLPCAAEAVVDGNQVASEPVSDRPGSAMRPSPRLAFLPPQLPHPAPVLLNTPPRPVDDLRGEGARMTLQAWRSHHLVVMSQEDVRDAWKKQKKTRPATTPAFNDASLLCRIHTRGNRWDIDGSPPELAVRIAVGFDADVAGRTFEIGTTRIAEVGLRHVSLRTGEILKVSLVDRDALVDDWGGMAWARFEGTATMALEHASFRAECRVFERDSTSP